MRVLVVEDDPEISSVVREGLEEEGFQVDIVRDGERGLRVASARSYGVIVLDLMLPTMDGLTLCRDLRSARVLTPILMLTAKRSLEDRIRGLEAGADDYLAKPFDYLELLARIRALIRRDKIVKSSVIQIDDLTVDTAAKSVTRGGKEIVLTSREYTLLEALASRQGQVVTRDMIQQGIWVDEFSTSNTVEVHVRNLRKKVDDPFERKLIHTVFGAGYVMRMSDSIDG